MSASAPLVTLPRIEAWLESLPGHRVVYTDEPSDPCYECVVARFLHANGYLNAGAGDDSWWADEPTDPRVPYGPGVSRFVDACDDADCAVSAAAALTLLRAVKGGQDA